MAEQTTGESPEPPARADRYREVANDLRALAAALKVPAERAPVVALAAEYERLADYVESSKTSGEAGSCEEPAASAASQGNGKSE